MGIGYYAFALFVSGLVCLVAILCKVLFSDVKRQHKLLDEKETKLLQLYQTVESIIEDWEDQAKAATEELKEYEDRITKMTAPKGPYVLPPPAPQVIPQEPYKPEPVIERLPREDNIDSSRIRAANEVLARAEMINSKQENRPTPLPVFQRLFDDTANETAPTPANTPPQQTRNEVILARASEGKTDAQIASELGITQNEVKLVIGITRVP